MGKIDLTKNYSLQVTGKQAMILFETTKVIRKYLGIEINVSQLNSMILQSFFSSNDYISLFGLSKELKFSMDEVLGLFKMIPVGAKQERNAYEWLLASPYRNAEIKKLFAEIRKEVVIEADSPKLTDIGEKKLCEVMQHLEFEYNRRFAKVAFQKGFKKLVIKSIMIRYILGHSTNV